MSSPKVASDNPLSGRYEILDLLGSGAAADVYRVRDVRTGTLRAAKVLKPANVANPVTLARFEDEFRILRTLRHPHLAEVYDYGWTREGGRFLVMELVDGVPLDDYFRENPNDIWQVLYELCEALVFVHHHKLLHQDIKPANILVKKTTAFGPELPLVKLIDFGLVYKRDAGVAVQLVGTPDYVAPEVARGDAKLTRAVDYYSLGATLYELLVGRPPFVGTPMEILRAHLDREPEIESEEVEWAELYPHVRALLTKDWRKRLEAFEEFRRAMTSRLTGGIEELDGAYRLARIESPDASRPHSALDAWLVESLAATPSGEPTNDAVVEVVGRSDSTRDAIVGALIAEARIRGCHVLHLGPGAPASQRGAGDRNEGQIERFNRIIQRLEGGNPVAAMILLNGIEFLSDDEAGFVRYLTTMRALRPDSANRYLFAVARDVGGAEHPLDSYLPVERTSVVLPTDRRARNENETHYLSAVAKTMFDSVLSDSQRTILAYVGSHSEPVPRAWVAEFVRLSDSEFFEEVDRLTTRHLLSLVELHGDAGLLASDVARSLGTSIVSRKLITSIHRDLATKWETTDATSLHSFAAHELAAYHHEAAYEDRRGATARVRALKLAWQAGALSDVERIAQASLEKLATSPILTRGLQHYFVKRWIRALWARNHHARAKQVIDDHILKRGDKIPPTLLAKYVRGVLDAEEPGPALMALERVSTLSLPRRVREQLLLEKALILCHTAHYAESGNILDELSKHNALSRRDQYRIRIYQAMNANGEARYDRIEGLLGEASKEAYRESLVDEFVLMSIIRAQTYTIRGEPKETLRIIAKTIAVAQRHELYLRVNTLYRLAAAAYQDLGQLSKATKSQMKAIPLASSLGMRQFEAMSWLRLVHYEQVLGSFGNAMRYLARSEAVMANSSYASDRAKLDLTRLQIHRWLKSAEVGNAVRRASWVADTDDANERGYYHLCLGDYLVDVGSIAEASDHYTKAEEVLRKARFAEYLALVFRAQLRVAILLGRDTAREKRNLDSQVIRSSSSPTVQLERALALLELEYSRRATWRRLGPLIQRCIRLAVEGASASTRLECLSLIFRAYARHGKDREASETFVSLVDLLRIVSGNLEGQYTAGLLDRLGILEMSREYDLICKRNKAGGNTSLVA